MKLWGWATDIQVFLYFFGQACSHPCLHFVQRPCRFDDVYDLHKNSLQHVTAQINLLGSNILSLGNGAVRWMQFQLFFGTSLTSISFSAAFPADEHGMEGTSLLEKWSACSSEQRNAADLANNSALFYPTLTKADKVSFSSPYSAVSSGQATLCSCHSVSTLYNTMDKSPGMLYQNSLGGEKKVVDVVCPRCLQAVCP